jgi:hypothetical protein
VLPFYVLHVPVTVAAAGLIVRWHVPALAQYTALVVLSCAGTLGLYEALVRRFRLTRVLLGLKPRLNPPSASPPRQLPVAGSATPNAQWLGCMRVHAGLSRRTLLPALRTETTNETGGNSERPAVGGDEQCFRSSGRRRIGDSNS